MITFSSDENPFKTYSCDDFYSIFTIDRRIMTVILNICELCPHPILLKYNDNETCLGVIGIDKRK